MSIDITTTTTSVFSSIVPCYSCHQPVEQSDAQPIRLLTPTGRYLDGVEVLNGDKTVYACDGCLSAEFEAAAQE